MNKRQFYLLVMVTAVAGFFGGAASERLFSANPSLAAKAAAPKTIAMREYRLLDAKGNTQVKIGFNAAGLATLFWNYQGKDPNLRGKEQALVIGTISMPQAPK